MRPSPAIFTSQTVERVNIFSKKTEVIWRGRYGAHIGVITANPVFSLIVTYAFMDRKIQMNNGIMIFIIDAA